MPLVDARSSSRTGSVLQPFGSAIQEGRRFCFPLQGERPDLQCLAAQRCDQRQKDHEHRGPWQPSCNVTAVPSVIALVIRASDSKGVALSRVT